MTRGQNNWDAMLAKLAVFARKHGHCSVRTNDSGDPQLGRWVAAQRHRRKLGALTESQVRQLDRCGFIWCPSDIVWAAMLKELEKFRKKYGHCDVPTKWPENIVMADWVQRQRLAKRKGRLSDERLRLLSRLGFSWSIYKAEKAEKRRSPAKVVKTEEPAEESVGERLYCLRQGLYVQHGGEGALHPALEAYMKAHRGELPPYIPLPRRRVRFVVGNGWKGPRTICWQGRGRLPQEVLDFVREHGTLPSCDEVGTR